MLDGKGLWLDQAYLTWTPPELGRHVTFAGGKFQNPWMSTPMVWDTDVNPEGFYEQFRFASDPVEVFATLGQTVIREVSDGDDAFMLAYQGGLKFGTGPTSLPAPSVITTFTTTPPTSSTREAILPPSSTARPCWTPAISTSSTPWSGSITRGGGIR